jgi:hypothetical protein
VCTPIANASRLRQLQAVSVVASCGRVHCTDSLQLEAPAGRGCLLLGAVLVHCSKAGDVVQQSGCGFWAMGASHRMGDNRV